MEKGQNNLMYVSGVVNTAKRIGWWAESSSKSMPMKIYSLNRSENVFSFPLNEIMQMLSS